jgi:hypothetical protein
MELETLLPWSAVSTCTTKTIIDLPLLRVEGCIYLHKILLLRVSGLLRYQIPPVANVWERDDINPLHTVTSTDKGAKLATAASSGRSVMVSLTAKFVTVLIDALPIGQYLAPEHWSHLGPTKPTLHTHMVG